MYDLNIEQVEELVYMLSEHNGNLEEYRERPAVFIREDAMKELASELLDQLRFGKCESQELAHIIIEAAIRGYIDCIGKDKKIYQLLLIDSMEEEEEEDYEEGEDE